MAVAQIFQICFCRRGDWAPQALRSETLNPLSSPTCLLLFSSLKNQAAKEREHKVNIISRLKPNLLAQRWEVKGPMLFKISSTNRF